MLLPAKVLFTLHRFRCGEAPIFGCVTGVDGVTAFRYRGSSGR